MPKRAIRPTPSTLLLAEYLADREGLTGAARDRFLMFLGESLGFHQPARPGHWRTLLALTLLSGLAGLAFDYPNHPAEASWRLAFWPGCVLLGVLLAWRLRQAEGKQAEPDLEIHWRVYCLLLRPVASNRQLQSIIDTYLSETYTAPDAADRPDLILTSNILGHHKLIEFKRPSLPVGRDAERQAISYADTLTGKLGIPFDIVVMGGEVDRKIRDEYSGKKTSFLTMASCQVRVAIPLSVPDR